MGRLALACALTALAMVAVDAVAQGREPIDLPRADARAATYAQQIQDEWNEDRGLYGEPYSLDSIALDPCEVDGRYRATCEVTFGWTDGDFCDSQITVRVSRRGRYAAQSPYEWDSCDSDEPGWTPTG